MLKLGKVLPVTIHGDTLLLRMAQQAQQIE